jgi:hypothetical protein
MIAERLALDFDRLGPDVTDSFAENGVVCLRGLVGPQEVAELCKWVETAIQNRARIRATRPSPTALISSRHICGRDFRDFATSPSIPKLPMPPPS